MEKETKKPSSGSRRDIILIAAFILIGAILGLVLLLTGKKGNIVQVRVDGEIVKEFTLDETITYEISGVDGGTNLLVIEDGEAFISEASCPDGLCINMGKISKVGQSVVCLPNKVVVEIAENGKDGDSLGVDFVTG